MGSSGAGKQMVLIDEPWERTRCDNCCVALKYQWCDVTINHNDDTPPMITCPSCQEETTTDDED